MLRERGQDKLWRQRVVTGNLRPLEKCCGKLTWRPNDVIGWGCYFNIDHIFDACIWIVAASPVRPIRSASSVTGHITVQVYQFHGSHVSTIWDVKPAKLVILRAKTHWIVIQFDPAVWKVEIKTIKTEVNDNFIWSVQFVMAENFRICDFLIELRSDILRWFSSTKEHNWIGT